MEKKTIIDNISNKIIPIEVSSTYNYMLEIMSQISYDYNSIIDNNDTNSFKFGDITYLKGSREEKLIEQNQLREKTNQLITLKRQFEDILSTGKKLTAEEFIKYKEIDKSLKEIQTKENEITKLLYNINNSINKSENERINVENNIEESRKRISENIKKLYGLLKNINITNVGLDRINGLKIKESHLQDLNNIIEKNELYNDNGNLLETLPLVDLLFKNSIELRINYYKEILTEALNLVESYKIRDNMNFEKIDQLMLLKNSGIEDIGNIYSPLNQKWNYESIEFIKTYVNLIKELKNVLTNEPTQEQISSIKEKWAILTREDSNYFVFNIHSLNQYINLIAQKNITNEKTPLIKK